MKKVKLVGPRWILANNDSTQSVCSHKDTLDPQGMLNKDGIVKDECMSVCAHTKKFMHVCACWVRTLPPMSSETMLFTNGGKTTAMLFWVAAVSCTEFALTGNSESCKVL